MLARLLLLALLLAVANAAQWAPTSILRISSASLASDCTYRPSVIINGTSPGPTLRFKEGEHIWIRVYNDIVDSNTTLHFHGLSQFASPFADGTPQTSQWPIAPGSYFDYEFMLSKGSAGTYMYHTHVDFQIVTAYGAFIVEESKPPFSYTEDLPILFGDFYHALDPNIVSGLLGDPFAWLGEPQSLPVNGNALGSCNSTVASCSDSCHHHIIEVKPDTTYRIRAIGITALTYLYIALESHPSLNLIEADAAYIEPTNSSYIQLHSGQRYSLLFRTKSEAELHKLGRRTFWGRIESRYRPVRDAGAFLLHYKGAEDAGITGTTPSPSTLNVTIPLPNEGTPWVDNTFAPLKGYSTYDDNEDGVPDGLPPASEVTRRLTISAQQLSVGTRSRWFVNDVVYREQLPSTPYLVQAYESPSLLQPNYTLAEANQGYDPSTNTYPVRLNETIEILFENRASSSGAVEAHPWHIHGQHPWLISSGVLIKTSNSSNATTTITPYSPRKPIRRDTNVVYLGEGASYSGMTIPNATLSGFTLVRMRAVTPGAWLVHCHIQPHALLGMAFVLLVGADHLPALPPDFSSEFLTYNASHSASAPPSYFELAGSA